MSAVETGPFLILGCEKGRLDETELKKNLETGTLEVKIDSMKRIITGLVDNENFPNLMIIIIRYILPMKEHGLKKLLLLYFELVPKTDSATGKLLPQMILVCDAFRKDISSPNEFIRGSTLRFLCKIKERDILEPLIPTIKDCLSHRNSYVRKNAILCMYAIYKSYPAIISDAPEVIYAYIGNEMDLVCKRNALIMLSECDLDLAIKYLDGCLDSILSLGDILQLAVIELIQLICKSGKLANTQAYIQAIFSINKTGLSSVRFEAAKTLLQLTESSTGIRSAILTYIEIIGKEPDMGVKSTILDHLIDSVLPVPIHKAVLEDVIVNLLKLLSCNDTSIRKKILSVTIPCLNSKNIEEIFSILKKSIQKSQDSEEVTSIEFKRSMIELLHDCSNKFSHVRAHIFPLAKEFLFVNDEQINISVIDYYKDLFYLEPENFAQPIFDILLDGIEESVTNKVFESSLWLLVELSKTESSILQALSMLFQSVGPLPIIESMENNSNAIDNEKAYDGVVSTSKTLLNTSGKDNKYSSDGGYKSQSAMEYEIQKSMGNVFGNRRISIRTRLLEGNFFDFGMSVAITLTKLCLKLKDLKSINMCTPFSELSDDCISKLTLQGMLVMTSIIRVAHSNNAHCVTGGNELVHMSQYNIERIMLCVQTLMAPNEDLTSIFVHECAKAFEILTNSSIVARSKKNYLYSGNSNINNKINNAVSDQIDFGLNANSINDDNSSNANKSDNQYALQRALYSKDAFAPNKSGHRQDNSNINKVFQLTGFTDPIYAEAYIILENASVLLDVMIVNQTNDTLQDLQLEISTVGDIKVNDKFKTYSICPQGVIMVKIRLHMNSTDRSIIYPSLTYNISGTTERCVLILNDITVNILDFIQPSSCTEQEFRAKWQSFEWENKVIVDTNITSLQTYLQNIMACTNMNPIEKSVHYEDRTDFLIANLSAKSIFGEDALANVCVQREILSGKIVGHIRVRAKYQGIALSLGDKITISQNVISV